MVYFQGKTGSLRNIRGRQKLYTVSLWSTKSLIHYTGLLVQDYTTSDFLLFIWFSFFLLIFLFFLFFRLESSDEEWRRESGKGPSVEKVDPYLGLGQRYIFTVRACYKELKFLSTKRSYFNSLIKSSKKRNKLFWPYLNSDVHSISSKGPRSPFSLCLIY